MIVIHRLYILNISRPQSPNGFIPDRKVSHTSVVFTVNGIHPVINNLLKSLFLLIRQIFWTNHLSLPSGSRAIECCLCIKVFFTNMTVLDHPPHLSKCELSLLASSQHPAHVATVWTPVLCTWECKRPDQLNVLLMPTAAFNCCCFHGFIPFRICHHQVFELCFYLPLSPSYFCTHPSSGPGIQHPHLSG